ncbi:MULTISPECIES: peptidoglycan-binding domain-containing protein [Nostocales]|uniref:Peptidoglycan-binding protein n=3 Tax=Nostocales TaxID=1161 RepID=A0A0C1RIK2_9CYAN|nr:peptidoglycan-binding domain-containing protein [Tolypothrix bouteillei]KAF3884734.1 peptidoglycan-binding protein [Tolypothrix bouteillei VB521301]
MTQAADFNTVLEAAARSISLPLVVQGDNGDAVKFLQQLLNAYRSKIGDGSTAPLQEDGDFGRNTFAAVVRFQQEYRAVIGDSTFSVDGKVGPLTWRALGDFAYRRCR